MKHFKLFKLIAMILAISTIVITSCKKDKEEEEPVTYTVTFDANGGSPTPAALNVKAGNKTTAPQTNPVKADYIFLYWYQNDTAKAYDFNTPVNANMTLYARWQDAAQAEYWQVSWELNGGSWPASGDNHATQVVKGGTLAEPVAPTKAGNTFEGWYKESTFANKISFPYNVSNVTGNFTLYAKWKESGTPGDDNGTIDTEGYRLFTSISALKSWLEKQADNTAETAYKLGLKNVNLDAGTNWADLGVAIGTTNKTKFVNLNLQGCTSTGIPDGHTESKWEGGKQIYTTYGVFVGCENLIVVTLPKELKTIGEYAFFRCTNLGVLSLPNGLTEIHGSAVRLCEALKSISLPEGLKIIDSYAFEGSGLTSITIPGSVKNLDGVKVFSSCDLQSIILKEGVESIGEMAFNYCVKLENVTLPSSLKKIGREAFRSCWNSYYKSFKTITIPASVTSLGDMAFDTQTLEEIIMLPATPPSLGLSVFTTQTTSGEPINLKIKVSAASLNAYKTADRWKDYASKIVAN